MKAPFTDALALLDAARAILITGHVNPDGDAIGSMLALGHALNSRGKTVTLALQDPVPQSCRFLPGADAILQPPVEGDFDLAVLLDCENPKRAGSLAEQVERTPKSLVVDHHLSEGGFGTVEVRDTTAAATGEILAEMLEAGGYAITLDVANCLLTALILDTGGFRYSNTSPNTLRWAARMVEAGGRIAPIYRELFENRAFSATQLMGRALSSLNAVAGGRIVYAALTRQDFAETGADENETEGINNQLMSVLGVEATALFRESSKGVRISLRSRSIVNCNAVAREFGGGGHLRAAGCTVNAPLPEAIGQVVAALQVALSAEG